MNRFVVLHPLSICPSKTFVPCHRRTEQHPALRRPSQTDLGLSSPPPSTTAAVTLHGISLSVTQILSCPQPRPSSSLLILRSPVPLYRRGIVVRIAKLHPNEIRLSCAESSDSVVGGGFGDQGSEKGRYKGRVLCESDDGVFCLPIPC